MELTFLSQTILDTGGPVPGDCWRTALACLLGFDAPTKVPHFVHEYAEDPNEIAWWEASVRFVEECLGNGDTLLNLLPQFPVYVNTDGPYQYVIAVGPSPRGDFLHSVIVDAVTGILVHDPHPSQSGLAGDPVEISAFASLVKGDKENND